MAAPKVFCGYVDIMLFVGCTSLEEYKNYLQVMTDYPDMIVDYELFHTNREKYYRRLTKQ